MKTITFLLASLLANAAVADTITGVMVLKGELAIETSVNGVKTECTVKVTKVKNDLQEDQFGNPAYLVTVKVSLKGKKVDHSKEYLLSNMFTENSQKTVRDLVYASTEGLVMKIKDDGRLASVEVPYKTGKVTCSF
ncbi:MAG TPA: hypothetical protein VNJ01_03950 [Bacteriovoracaceae bacterium]|nr:hypothetical protein [Bacteriovoracaceae bacterium]